MGRGTQQLPRIIIFDLDGTILDTEPVSLNAWIQAAAEYGLELSMDQVTRFIGLTNQAVAELAKREFGEDLPIAQIFQRKRALTQVEFRAGIPLKKGVRELLATLQELGIRTCIATSSGKDRSNRFLQSVNLLDQFEFLISGEEVTHSKPHPEIFLRCLDQANVPANSAIVVEDSKNGIIGARRSGAKTVLIPDLVTVDEEMAANTDFVFESLLDLRDYILTLA